MDKTLKRRKKNQSNKINVSPNKKFKQKNNPNKITQLMNELRSIEENIRQ